MNLTWPDDFIDKVICGDCLEIMPLIPDKAARLVLADPPYNAKDIGPNKRVYSRGIMQLPEEEYNQFCSTWIVEALRIAETVVVTPGIGNVCRYPQPTWIICWHKPAAVSFNRMGGYNAWEPVFLYGKPARRLGQDYIKFNTLNLKKGIESQHPCPKVPALWNWLVYHFSGAGDVVIDPFLGSGTTATSCEKLGRHYIGIEMNPDYCKIAEKRLASMQLELPLAQTTKPHQMDNVTAPPYGKTEK